MDFAGKYFAAFPRQEDPCELEWVERRLLRAEATLDPLDDVVRGSPAKVRAWMERKAQLADGTAPGVPSTSPNRVMSTLATTRTFLPALGLHDIAEGELWSIIEVALLRKLAGVSWTEVCQRTGLSSAAARRRFEKHAYLLSRLPYQARLAELVAMLFAPAPVKR